MATTNGPAPAAAPASASATVTGPSAPVIAPTAHAPSPLQVLWASYKLAFSAVTFLWWTFWLAIKVGTSPTSVLKVAAAQYIEHTTGFQVPTSSWRAFLAAAKWIVANWAVISGAVTAPGAAIEVVSPPPPGVVGGRCRRVWPVVSTC
ncbi:hypothetical protein AMAG_15700 [Allomyces macrogynus ATCC 38327]|uniref:Uncharacterized protein n=1 Tax=Allomyces macrogynus (strain ATCC 38327) TaxID=578462 RepID=A0A0L0TAC4_ALLM3|nr:hypothetical protein AMAG_15700 [Allomyces macrogynus ATCC 38327]|eukprot:KNE71474.1 hypothetical protein AMAG_15700 [Allomyces macrogynus ATCC 38327]